MMGFDRLGAFLLVLPWLAFGIYFSLGQFKALRSLEERIAPRFRPRFTVHRPSSLGMHLALLGFLGLTLIFASAKPTVPGDTEITAEGGRVLLLIDASASMNAQDVAGVLGGEETDTRFQVAMEIARDLVERLPDHRFGVASFSGVSTLELPMTGDHSVISEVLRVLEIHTFYQNTGSSFSEALDSTLQFATDPSVSLQVVLLSDGELPQPEDYSDSLDAVAERGITLHGVAIGSEAGQSRLIFDFRDVVAKKEEKGVLREFHTQRVDEHLRRMAQATDGTFMIADLSSVDRLEEVIRSRPSQSGRLAEDTSRRDVSRIPLVLFSSVSSSSVSSWDGADHRRFPSSTSIGWGRCRLCTRVEPPVSPRRDLGRSP